jgi:hypothetical protein
VRVSSATARPTTIKKAKPNPSNQAVVERFRPWSARLLVLPQEFTVARTGGEVGDGAGVTASNEVYPAPCRSLFEIARGAGRVTPEWPRSNSVEAPEIAAAALCCTRVARSTCS